MVSAECGHKFYKNVETLIDLWLGRIKPYSTENSLYSFVRNIDDRLEASGFLPAYSLGPIPARQRNAIAGGSIAVRFYMLIKSKSHVKSHFKKYERCM